MFPVIVYFLILHNLSLGLTDIQVDAIANSFPTPTPLSTEIPFLFETLDFFLPNSQETLNSDKELSSDSALPLLPLLIDSSEGSENEVWDSVNALINERLNTCCLGNSSMNNPNSPSSPDSPDSLGDGPDGYFTRFATRDQVFQDILMTQTERAQIGGYSFLSPSNLSNPDSPDSPDSLNGDEIPLDIMFTTLFDNTVSFSLPTFTNEFFMGIQRATNNLFQSTVIVPSLHTLPGGSVVSWRDLLDGSITPSFAAYGFIFLLPTIVVTLTHTHTYTHSLSLSLCIYIYIYVEIGLFGVIIYSFTSLLSIIIIITLLI